MTGNILVSTVVSQWPQRSRCFYSERALPSSSGDTSCCQLLPASCRAETPETSGFDLVSEQVWRLQVQPMKTTFDSKLRSFQNKPAGEKVREPRSAGETKARFTLLRNTAALPLAEPLHFLLLWRQVHDPDLRLVSGPAHSDAWAQLETVKHRET